VPFQLFQRPRAAHFGRVHSDVGGIGHLIQGLGGQPHEADGLRLAADVVGVADLLEQVDEHPPVVLGALDRNLDAEAGPVVEVDPAQ